MLLSNFTAGFDAAARTVAAQAEIAQRNADITAQQRQLQQALQAQLARQAQQPRLAAPARTRRP